MRNWVKHLPIHHPGIWTQHLKDFSILYDEKHRLRFNHYKMIGVGSILVLTWWVGRFWCFQLVLIRWDWIVIKHLLFWLTIRPCDNNTHTINRYVAHPIAFVTLKSYHTTSQKRPITLVSELNILKTFQCWVTKSTRYDLSGTKAMGSVTFLTIKHTLTLGTLRYSRKRVTPLRCENSL